MGVSYVIPFSSFHKMQRADSVWVQEFIHEPEEYAIGFASPRATLLPAFVRFDCVRDTWTAIHPPRTSDAVLPPEAFGDNWNEPLTGDDEARARQYFQSIEHLRDSFDFIQLRVGGHDHSIDLARKKFNRGVTFEAPRASLMCAIDNEIFDDMLIGNFMKTTYHGTGEFAYGPFINRMKWADNGRARSLDDLAGYLAEYKLRAGTWDRLRFGVEQSLLGHAHALGAEKTAIYRLGRRVYRQFTR